MNIAGRIDYPWRFNRFCVFMFIFFIFPFLINAGNKKQVIDSLTQLISSLPDNEKKVDALNAISWELLYKSDEADKYLSLAFELAKKLNYKKGLAQTYNDMGALASIKSNQKDALKYYIESLKLKEELKDERGIGISYINIGQIYSSQDQFKQAFESYNIALNSFIKIKNEKEIAATYNSIGTLFEEFDNHDSAIYYMEKSLQIRKRINDEEGLSETYGNLGVVYKSKGDFKKAIVYYKLDNIFNKKAGNTYSMIIGMNNLSILYSETGDVDEAIRLATESAELSAKYGYLESMRHALGNLADFYYSKKNYKVAYHYIAKWATLRDSLKNEDLSRALNDLSIKYETDKKDQQNQLLQAQNKLSEKTIKEQQIITYFIITGLILALGLAFFIFRGLKQQRIANKIISKQKLLVEEKQKEILDSIQYAKRIQKAHLPTENFMDKQLGRLKK